MYCPVRVSSSRVNDCAFPLPVRIAAARNHALPLLLCWRNKNSSLGAQFVRAKLAAALGRISGHAEAAVIYDTSDQSPLIGQTVDQSQAKVLLPLLLTFSDLDLHKQLFAFNGRYVDGAVNT
jgi:hypothetical protein